MVHGTLHINLVGRGVLVVGVFRVSIIYTIRCKEEGRTCQKSKNGGD